MKLGIVLNTNDPETAWNGLRLGNETLRRGNEVSLFLLGKGVEIESIKDDVFDVSGEFDKFASGGGKMLACGSCLKVRHQQAGVCPVSTMPELTSLVLESDRVVTLG
ncbi:MAG: DsrE family protein [Dehalococcoidia bacterium]|nr:DsrE family protein [Dehalococcoidia bacterium]